MSRKRDTNWARDEITVLLDGITDITRKRSQDGKRTNSREIFEYAARKLGEKGHSARAEREKCRAKWKKMKEEYTHAKRAREGDTNYKEAPGIVPFYDRMDLLINGPIDNISPHSTIVRRTNSISNSSSTSNTSSISTNNTTKTTNPSTSTTSTVSTPTMTADISFPNHNNLTNDNNQIGNSDNNNNANVIVPLYSPASRNSSGLRASARIAANTTISPLTTTSSSSTSATVSTTVGNLIANIVTTNGLTNSNDETTNTFSTSSNNNDYITRTSSSSSSSLSINNNNNSVIGTSPSSSNLIVLNNIQRSTPLSIQSCPSHQINNCNNNENPDNQTQILGINNNIPSYSSSSPSTSTGSANSNNNLNQQPLMPPQQHLQPPLQQTQQSLQQSQQQPKQSHQQNTNPGGSDYCATTNNTNSTTNLCPIRPKEADVSYRVSGGCRQITIFGDQDIDIKFRGDCVTINKIELDYSGSDGS